MEWIPKTVLGGMVKNGKIKTMSQALKSRLPLREPEIVDILLPNLEDQVLDVNMVQRMTDSGRRVKFGITVVVGNSNGFVGLGHSKGNEVGPAIKKAIDNAKLNIIEIRRGCGSWECGCWTPHSLPFEVTGKSGSTIVTLKPAPRGVSLAAGDTAKQILRLAGIKDAWVSTKGQTRTTINFAKATFDALRKTVRTKVMSKQVEKLKIVSGSVELPEELREAEMEKPLEEEAEKKVELIKEEEKEKLGKTKKEGEEKKEGKKEKKKIEKKTEEKEKEEKARNREEKKEAVKKEEIKEKKAEERKVVEEKKTKEKKSGVEKEEKTEVEGVGKTVKEKEKKETVKEGREKTEEKELEKLEASGEKEKTGKKTEEKEE